MDGSDPIERERSAVARPSGTPIGRHALIIAWLAGVPVSHPRSTVPNMPPPTDAPPFESSAVSLLLDAGWSVGDAGEWDAARSLFPRRVVEFVRVSQPEAWAKLLAWHVDEADLAERIVANVVDELDRVGTLELLRRGFKFHGRRLYVACFRPAHQLSSGLVARYEQNRLTVTRQVPVRSGGDDRVGLLFAVNGVPVATCEVADLAFEETWCDAAREYRHERDPNVPLFRFGHRTLVHFVVGRDEVGMATRLAGERTRFLPFNRGSNPGAVDCGAGNPEHPSGVRTGYFWRETLQRDRFLEILGSYMFVERDDDTVYDEHGAARTVCHETMIFPRFHQIDAISGLVDAARSEGAGRSYLVQHSAGSGKTNSISWLAHRLSTLHDEADKKVFDGVLVISDRRSLDRQLRDAVTQLSRVEGVVEVIDKDSRQLARALTDGTMIVVTTLQKFPFVIRGLLAAAEASGAEAGQEHSKATGWAKKIAGRRYAVIVDEAHSSQTGDNAREMKAVLGAHARAGGGTGDWEDSMNAVVESRGQQPNLSFFAFTATPKDKTVELFGHHPSRDEPPQAFHRYSMRQAIEEGFILDVLTDYTDYGTHSKLTQQDEDASKIARFAAPHADSINEKTEVIVEHFRNHVRHRIDGRAKAMIVTSSRLHAVRYKLAIETHIAEHGYDDLRPLVAFSGTVTDNDTDYTEPNMNTDTAGRPISETALPARFDSPDHRILIVAEKYQTGYDQPLLQAMYIDKKLEGLHAVQTLSRLNRVAQGKDAPTVLDFVNDPDGISEAFASYYGQG